MTTERIKEIQSKTAHPESVSVQQALLQVWNETEQEQLRLRNVVKPKGTFCRCGKPYSQKDLEDGMCNKCCAPTG